MSNKNTQPLWVLAAALGSVLVFGTTACKGPVGGDGIGDTPDIEDDTSTDDGVDDAPGGNGDIQVISGSRTMSMVNASRVLDSMVSCLGVGTPSNDAVNAYEEKKGTFSENGWANSVTAAMLGSFAAVGAEVCEDLVNAEAGLAEGDRRIYNAIDFNAGPSAISNADFSDVVRRLARSCWSRNETSEELDIISNQIDTIFSDATDNGTSTRNQMVTVCAGMLGSFSFYEM